jgi:CheY-like chemotaxis protein
VVGTAVHDFSNLLATIVLNLNLIEKRVTDPAVLWFVSNALRAADRGSNLSQRLLAFAGKQQLARKPIDLSGLVSTRRDLLSRTVGPMVAPEFRLAPNPWPALADADHVELAVVNLALNARDAMPEGGRLTIETANRRLGAGEADCAAGDYVMLSLTDTGPGMSEDTLHRASEPFFTTREEQRRLGLGLGVVFGLAKQHGGGAGIASSSEGTRAEIYLPRANSIAEEASAEDRGELNRMGNIAASVLVVDDDVDLCAVALDGLHSLGCEVVLAENGPSALEVLASDRHIDLPMVDVRMAGMNGLELIERARAVRPQLKVLVMTGYAEAPELLARQGEIAAIRKPFRAADLAHQIAIAVPRS